jgi:lipoate-protein ligase B
MRTLLYKHLGQSEYLSVLSLQERIVEKKTGAFPDVLLLVEHPHVFTIGRGGKEKHLLERGGIPFYRTSRGGDITYHGPGQLVAYPLIDLRSKLRQAVHVYLRGLEKVLIKTLGAFGIAGRRNPPWTGVWVENRKIASVGISVRRGITCHGAALNVNTDLRYFGRIIPCGLPWAETTSMQRELGRELSMLQVKQAFIRAFVRQFHYGELEELCHEDIHSGSRLEPPEVPVISASSGL